MLKQQARETRNACAEAVNKIGVLVFDMKEEAELVNRAILNIKQE